MSKTAAATTSYAYDKVDRLTTAGGVAYSFDNNGNQTGRGSDAFASDQANRLISVTIGSNTTQFTYDGDGNRASKTYCDCAPERYTYDVNRALPVLLQDGQRTYVWGLGLAYEVTNSGAVLVPHVDGLGSVRALSDGRGAILQTYETDAFGVPTLVSGPSRQSLRYTGEPYDAETGLVYLRARYYDPQTGRFLSRDSFEGFGGAPQSLNRYSYAQHNPTTLTDPSGHTPTSRALIEGPWRRDCSDQANALNLYLCHPTKLLMTTTGQPVPLGLGDQLGSELASEFLKGASSAGSVFKSHGNTVRLNPNRSGHIFRDELGHVDPATEASRQRFARLFEKVGADHSNLRLDYPLPPGAQQAGVQAYAKVYRNGKQVWVYVRNGQITDAGVNLPGAHR